MASAGLIGLIGGLLIGCAAPPLYVCVQRVTPSGIRYLLCGAIQEIPKTMPARIPERET